jgi:RNA polymerase primary sigma factor
MPKRTKAVAQPPVALGQQTQQNIRITALATLDELEIPLAPETETENSLPEVAELAEIEQLELADLTDSASDSPLLPIVIDRTISSSKTSEDTTRFEVETNAGDSIQLYMREIGNTPLLKAEEEISLAKAMAQGQEAANQLLESGELSKKQLEQLQVTAEDYTLTELGRLDTTTRLIIEGAKARKRLIQANLRLVVSVARKYQNRGLTLLDLIQEGNIGLMRAADKFKPELGFKFSTYAVWWIRQALSRANDDQSRMVRLPVHISEAVNLIRRESQKFRQEFGREPDLQDLSTILQMPVEKIKRLQLQARQTVSLETPVGDEGDNTLGDFIEDTSAVLEIEEAGNLQNLRDQLALAMQHLSPREQQILRLRFGLDDNQYRTLEEVGKEIGVTRERVRQIENKILRKLRHPRFSKELKAFLD